MSQSTKVVFLLDLASFFSRDDRLCVANYQHAVNAVKYCCLKFLTHFGTKRTRWGYKFYSSSGLARQRMEKRLFCEFNLENFEDFEDDLVRRFEHYRQACEAIDRSGSCSGPEKDAPCSVLRAALTQVFSEYQWDAPSLSSPVKWKSRRRKRNCVAEHCEGEEEVNYIFNISPCPRTEDDVAAFLKKAPATDGEVADHILPGHLRRLLLASASVKFFWIDTTPLETGREDFVGGVASTSPKLRGAVATLGGRVISIATLVSAGSVGHATDGRGAARKPLSAVPFSDVADFYLSKATVKSPQKTATVVYRETQIGCAVLCASSAPEESAVGDGWKEIRILCRTRQDPKLCIFQSSRAQTFRCVEASVGNCSEAPVNCLAEMLSCLANDGSAFFVEVASEQSSVKLFGFLFPIDCALFCVHTVTEPGPLASGALLENISREFADGSRSELRCVLPRSDVGSLLAKPFTADVLERWFVPASVSPRSQGSGNQEPCSPRDGMLRMLRREYQAKFSTGKDRGEQRLMSDQPLRPVAAQKLRKYNSASVPMSNTSSAVSRETALPRQEDAPPIKSCSDADQLVAHLRRSYDGALNSELPVALLTCAQNIVSVVKRFAESEGNDLNSAETARKLLRAHFTVGCIQIAEKYANSKDDTSLKRRVREYQLQALLALEEEANFRETSNCVERVTSLLRTLSFIYSPASASEFLKGIVCSTYLTTLKDIIIEIGEELNVPILSDEHDSSLASEGDFFQLGSLPSVQSQESYLSSIPSSLNLQRGTDNIACAAEGKTLARVGLSQPLAPEKRQIVVKQASSKRKAADAMVAKKPAKRVKTKDAQGSENECGREKAKQNPPSTPKAKRRRVLKTTFVPETPHRKQGRKAVQRRQELLRKKFSVTITLPVVEETPEKKSPSGPTTSKTRTPVRTVTPEALRNAAVQCAHPSATPKRSLRPKTLFSEVQATPPEWNGSECLFLSPASEASFERAPRSEKTPSKCGLSTGNESVSGNEHCFLTPRRRVSKKLLSSPSTPKSTSSRLSTVEASPAMQRALSTSPSASFPLLSPKAETPRRLFSVKSCESPALRVHHTLDVAVTTQVGSGEHLCSTSSEQTLPVDSSAPSTESSQSSAGSPVLAECTSRFTRSKSRETGLTPHQLFVLSQKSPVKDRSPASKKRTNNTVGCTPRHGATQKVSYTPPSALSLLHLTSSPMLLKKSK